MARMTDSAIIANNVISNGAGVGISCDKTSTHPNFGAVELHLMVNSNVVTQCGGNGVTLADADTVVVVGNIVRDCGGPQGIGITSGIVTAVGNECHNSGISGLILADKSRKWPVTPTSAVDTQTIF